MIDVRELQNSLYKIYNINLSYDECKKYIHEHKHYKLQELLEHLHSKYHTDSPLSSCSSSSSSSSSLSDNDNYKYEQRYIRKKYKLHIPKKILKYRNDDYVIIEEMEELFNEIFFKNIKINVEFDRKYFEIV